MFVLATLLAVASEKNTNLYIKGGIYGNYNSYSANFEQLPGYPVCCSGFDNASGFAPAIMIGGEYKIPNGLFGFKTLYSFDFFYSDMSAKFVTTDQLGYDIEADDYTEIYADYVIDPSINAIVSEHTLKMYFIDAIPLSVKAGINIGIPVTKTFEQYTEIVSPEGIKFETGSNRANEYTGDIPSATSLYFGLTFGIGYDIYKSNNYIITPEVKYNLGLNNVTSDVDWKISTIQAGVSFAYNFPKAKVPPPAKPPMPSAPEMYKPPVENDITVNIKFMENGKEISKTGLSVKEDKYYQKDVFIPVIFIENETEGHTQEYDPDKIIDLTAKKLNSGNGNLTVYINYTDENDKIKGEKLFNDLYSKGIDKNKIQVKYNSLAEETYKYPELEEEAKSVQFEFSDGNNLLTDTKLIKTDIEKENKEIRTKISVEGSEGKYDFSAYALLNGKKINVSEGETSIDITDKINIDDNNKIEVFAEVTDEWKNKFSSSKELPVQINRSVNTYINYDKVKDESTYTLGYFNFDSNVLKDFDNDLKSKINDAVAKGKKIRIVALTDDLGANYYNKNLAMERAKAAIKELGLKESDTEIIIKENGIYTNDSPYGRMMNRSVIIEIQN